MPEPILWAHKVTRAKPVLRLNPETGQREQVIDDETGEPVTERIPQIGHVGDYENPVAMRRPGWVHVLKHDGHEVRVKLTNAAAQEDLNHSYANFMRAKIRHFGWVIVGTCPLVAVASGDIRKQHLAARSLLTERACERGSFGELNPCRHYLAERDARRARHGVLEARRNSSFKPEADRLIEAQAKQTTEIVTGVGGAIADALRGVLVPVQSDPPAPDRPSRKG
jgi:hypothetical protein